MTIQRTHTDAALLSRLVAALADELPAAAALRRRIHADPRLAHAEDATAEVVLDALDRPPAVAVTTGRLARIDVGAGAPVAIRAELDALPIAERTGVDWAATNGAMHACGHDVHLAALVAAARSIRSAGGPRPLLAVLQPREETVPCGAQDILAATAFADAAPAAMIGVHVNPELRPGVVAAQPGAVNAACDEFRVTVSGSAGHGAYPHLSRDPVPAAAAVITAIGQLAGRRTDPMRPAVVTVGSVHGGSAANAITGDVVLTGTIRSFDATDRDTLTRLVPAAAQAAAAALGCDAVTEIARGEPVLRNDPRLAAAVAAALVEHGVDATGEHRSCGSDDFAYYGHRLASLMCFVGVDSPDGVGLHHPAFLPPDRAVADVAVTMLAAYVGACGYADGYEGG